MFIPFFVRVDNMLHSIKPEDVVCLQMKENYLHIYLTNRKPLVVRSTLTDALSKLPDSIFIKTHRSFAVSILFMDKIERYNLVVGKKDIPIARNLYNHVLDQLVILGD